MDRMLCWMFLLRFFEILNMEVDSLINGSIIKKCMIMEFTAKEIKNNINTLKTIGKNWKFLNWRNWRFLNLWNYL